MRPLKLAALTIPTLLCPACFWERLPSSCIEKFYVSAATLSGTVSQFGHYLALNDQFVAVSSLSTNAGTVSARIYVFKINAPTSGSLQLLNDINGRNGFDISNDTTTYLPPDNNPNLQIKSTQITGNTMSYGRSMGVTYFDTYGESILSRHGRVFVSNYGNMAGPPILTLGATQIETLFGNSNFPGTWGRPLLGSSRWLVTGGQTESKNNDFQFSSVANANVISNWKLVGSSALSDNGCTITSAHDPGQATDAALVQPNAALAGDILVAQANCKNGNKIVMFTLTEGGSQPLENEVINSIPGLQNSSLLTIARDSEHESDLTAIGIVSEIDQPGAVWVTRVSPESPGLAPPTQLVPTNGSASTGYGSGLAVSGALVAVGDPTAAGGAVHIFQCQ